jgi:mRNA interferase MazF
MMMEKDFDKWNLQKKDIDKKEIKFDLFFHEREVWWCAVGVNIGIESDGKNENFERPVIIIKKFNGQMLWVIPLTSRERKGEHYVKVSYEKGISWACLSQIKTVSTKRLLRKVGMVSKDEFGLIKVNIIRYLIP